MSCSTSLNISLGSDSTLTRCASSRQSSGGDKRGSGIGDSALFVRNPPSDSNGVSCSGCNLSASFSESLISNALSVGKSAHTRGRLSVSVGGMKTPPAVSRLSLFCFFGKFINNLLYHFDRNLLEIRL